jgi:ectoine hydroxylase-related dioxygenase (phytanoyl-CoA dioxygenase family)
MMFGPLVLSSKKAQLNGVLTTRTNDPILDAPRPNRLALRIVPEGELLDSNDALQDEHELRRRLARDGYLFVRGIVDRPRLSALRLDILRLCSEHGWLANGSSPDEGLYAGTQFPDYTTQYMPLYRKLIRLRSFNELSRSPEIVRLFERLLGGPILVHPRNIARISFPRHYENTTQPHQDFWYIRGTPETFTTWIPCGDCARELGGLALVEGSHRGGFRPHQPAIGAGGSGIPARDIHGRWLSTDYLAGDLLLFHAFTIHGALENRSPNRIRLSLDYRYQRADAPVDESSLRDHAG